MRKVQPSGRHNIMNWSPNAIKVLEARYLRKDENGVVVETPDEMLHRVAKAVAQADISYMEHPTGRKGGSYADETEREFYEMLCRLDFLPNSPTLMNAGTKIGQLSACFVIPVGDSMDEIFTAVRHMALIHQSGGGTGFSFSRLRPKGDVVCSTGGIASGPVSFMRVFDVATDIIKQGGRRRGANMGILRVDHPDIIDFITIKAQGKGLLNFNLSVAVTDEFIKNVKEGKEYELINPRTGKAVRKEDARRIFDLIVSNAWKCGDPGLIFIDEINRHNATAHISPIEATNPCGEQPLLAYESCNLGSINLSNMAGGGRINWELLGRTVLIAVHFLDNIIDISVHPLPEIEAITKADRRIGLGVMGFAEMLIKMNIAYDSDEALKTAEEVMRFINEKANDASFRLAEERGSFPNFKGSLWERIGFKKMRNAALTTIAPTGTISIIAGVSSGIEPLFALSYFREVMDGTKLLEENKLFQDLAKEKGFYTDKLALEIARRGSIKDIPGIPEDVKKIFVTAFDIAPLWHVKMQAAFQKYSDSGVSKTVNLPQDATEDDVRTVYLAAHELKCKGITIFRYGSAREQVLKLNLPADRDRDFINVDAEYSGECRICST
ncbi:MAG: adenosylcobalamin-dependent ribonucleoside-diphosphate reductase [Candidatus Omnitrophica bacterium]|nr:adenosylcobalamin-dependent ribonucleoside-diphosphate reductase [Candidatus Omnitrophota bacterium]